MNRREFVSAASAASLAAGASPPSKPPRRFKLKYAPHFGMFSAHAGRDLIDQINFMADQGFRAFEDNGMKNRPVEVQNAIGKALEKRGLTMGVFVAHAQFGKVSFAGSGAALRASLVKEMEQAVEVAKRVSARWCTVVPGRFDLRADWEYQTANVIDNLRACAEVCEKAGLVMVLEALNHRRDHPGLYLTTIAQGYLLCRGVDSPSCKILDDLYHQQVTEGNLIANIDKAWSEIAYFQVGDHPGRNEPGTGEVNFKNVFRHLHSKGFEGVIGMEHGNSKGGIEGEKAVLAAYHQVDSY